MGVVVNFVEANQAPLQLIGSIVLGIFGYYIFQSNPTRNLKKHREKKLSFTQDFITAFLLTFSNVLIVLLYIGLFARFGFVLPEHSFWLLVLGIVCIGLGAVLWWFGITYIIGKLRKWFKVTEPDRGLCHYRIVYYRCPIGFIDLLLTMAFTSNL